ncbi:flagellar motor switch protein FliN [Kineosporia succinea]|uniref:Flagellar motor switch protein FliN/FliY n=1 Tax=Kineosporia succinea TaxID=84632 RepID=A0ABT9P1E8_9ACTN|nr:flagellar motor switch protein FliN [Kineosporia succinea]MDP9826491.1 flagellar motor switch protein FliN/FliY [Kineosporia succinea]
MSFSASPLVPEQRSGDAGNRDAAAQAAIGAVREALPQIPSASPLTIGDPIPDPGQATLPSPAGAAITAFLSGGIEGKVLLVVGQELVDALAGTPFGSLEPAQALKPALDSIATSLGGRLDGDPTATPVEDCLDVLTGGTTVILPLSGPDGAVTAVVGLSITQMAPPAASVPQQRGPGQPAAGNNSWGIEMLRDVEMEVTCELGRTRMTVRQLLALAPGDVVELDRLAGSPADLLVNGTLLARGEVVVVDESFGLRITEIVTRDAT